MKSIRLLPVVIFAALALLLFKGIGLVTTGGYVLIGRRRSLAATAEHAPTAEEPAAATMTLPAEPTIDGYQPDARRRRARRWASEADGEHGAPGRPSTATRRG